MRWHAEKNVTSPGAVTICYGGTINLVESLKWLLHPGPVGTKVSLSPVGNFGTKRI